jgi:hypothetical protein
MLEQVQEYARVLESIILLGTPLTIIVAVIIQAIKRRVELPGEVPKFIAVGVGTLIGSIILLFGDIFNSPETWYAIAVRVLAAGGWSFISSEFYELLKGSSERGTVAGINKIEEQATLSLGNLSEEQQEV